MSSCLNRFFDFLFLFFYSYMYSQYDVKFIWIMSRKQNDTNISEGNKFAHIIYKNCPFLLSLASSHCICFGSFDVEEEVPVLGLRYFERVLWFGMICTTFFFSKAWAYGDVRLLAKSGFLGNAVSWGDRLDLATNVATFALKINKKGPFFLKHTHTILSWIGISNLATVHSLANP